MSFVLSLHIAAAIFVIGPLTFAAAITPRVLQQGADGLGSLRLLHRTTRVYGAASLVVALLGVGLVRRPYTFGQFWVSSSLTLYVVAVALLLGVVGRDQRKAISALEAGGQTTVLAGRITAVAGAVALMWLAIVLLMVFKPGR